MVRPLGWARCLDNVADVLRRGAWYPIVESGEDDHVVVEVRRTRVRLSRADVDIRDAHPETWSIVVRTGVLRPTLGGGKELITSYAVCPLCHERQDFEGEPQKIKCTRCGKESPVDWTKTC